MNDWLKFLTSWTTLSVLLLLFAMSLAGCASRTPVATQQEVPTAWTQPQSQTAEDYSKKVQKFLQKVENFFSETQHSMTH